MCRQFPEHLRMYVSINPHFPENIKEDLAKFDQWAPYAVGLKFLADYHRVAVTDKAYEYALKFAEERALPILNHTWGGSACNGGPIMLEVAQKYPRIKFFMGHSIYGDWEYARRVVKLVEMVGSERLLYGTDLPWFDEFQGIGGVLSAKITEDDMRNILYRNVERIFGKNW
jgi:predicted TIM-barrel fold metal-dependent hydrolase